MAMFDTHRAVKTLTGAGFTEDQAEALINAVGERNEDLATKADLFATKAELREEIADVRSEIATVRAEVATVRTELKEDIAAVRADMQALELRMTLRLGGLVVAATVVLALLQLIP